MVLTSQFSDMTSLSNLLVQVSCQYHHWFESYDNFFSQGTDQKSGNRKYPRLSFVQYLETGASKEYQI